MTASVVIVEDNDLLRDVIVLALESAGYKVVVSDGPAATRVVKAARPRLVLLDLALSGVSGPDVFADLRSDPTTAGIPVIAMTGGAVPDEMEPDDALTKPFPMQTLLVKVAAWVNLPARTAAQDDESSARPAVIM